MTEAYVRAGFLCNLLEPWVGIEGSEWGGQLTAMHDLATRCLGLDDERAVVVTDWMVDEISRAFTEEWWGDEEMYLPQIVKARDNYQRIVEAWRERSQSFNLPPSEAIPDGVDASRAFEETLASLPEWIRLVDPDDRRRAILVDLEIKKRHLERELAATNRLLAEVSDERWRPA